MIPEMGDEVAGVAQLTFRDSFLEFAPLLTKNRGDLFVPRFLFRSVLLRVRKIILCIIH